MTVYERTESGLSFLLKTIVSYQEPGCYLFAAILFLAVIVFFGGRRIRSALLWPFLILCAAVFNPFIFPRLFVRWPSLIEQYYSFLWILPVPVMIAAGAVILSSHMPKQALKIVMLLALTGVLAYLAVPSVRSYADLEIPSNSMKADVELVTICEYIRGRAETETPLIAFEKEAFEEEATAYDPAIRISDLFVSNEDGDRVMCRAPSREQYIVIDAEHAALEETLKSNGYRAIARTPECMVFAPMAG